MENLRRSFSDKFLEKVEELGEILPINDELFYIVFKSNNKAASVRFKKKNLIKVVELCVTNHEPLSINRVNEGLEEDGNEGNVLWALKTINNN